MTDNDIIKALKCCFDGYCEGCAFDDDLNLSCKDNLTENALNLIERQKAEIEILKTKLNNKYRDCVFISRVPIHKDHIRDYSNFLCTFKHEAIKEFIKEVVNNILPQYMYGHEETALRIGFALSEKAKEMTERKEDEGK